MRITPAVKVILILNLVFYVLAYWVTPMVPLDGYTDWFTNFNALHPVQSEGFAVYQYVTYMFMHGGFLHLFWNMWALMIFGNAVEQQMGTKQFWIFYLVSGVGSALLNQFMSFIGIMPPTFLVGASGAIYGVMAAAAFFFPNAKLFIIPIPFPIKLKWLVAGYFVLEFGQGLFAVDRVAHFAHVGGLVVGLIYALVWWQIQKSRQNRGGYNQWTSSSTYNSRSNSYSGSYDKGEGFFSKMKETFSGSRKPKMKVTEVRETNAADHAYNERKRQENDEIDRILDKIRKNGYQNLTEEEKAKLFDASKKMNS